MSKEQYDQIMLPKLPEKFRDALHGEVEYGGMENEKEGKYLLAPLEDQSFLFDLTVEDPSKYDGMDGAEEFAEYGDDYQLVFFAEYYPYTEEVALRVGIDAASNELHDKLEEILYGERSRVKDGYIQLNDAEKDTLRTAFKDYAADEIEEFFRVEEGGIDKE